MLFRSLHADEDVAVRLAEDEQVLPVRVELAGRRPPVLLQVGGVRGQLLVLGHGHLVLDVEGGRGETGLLLVQNEKYKAEFCYVSWLCRCYIVCNEPQLAWETYVRMETGNESFNLLHLIANDCYKMGHFYYACKAFDVLERLDPDPEFWEGKRGAAVGVFQKVVAGKERPDKLQEVVGLLRSTNNPQVEYMINRVMKKWARENGVNV